MGNVYEVVEDLIKKEYPDLHITFLKEKIQISKSSYFKISLSPAGQKNEKETVLIFVYTGLLGYILNRNFGKRVSTLKANIEKVLRENGFKFSYLSQNLISNQ